MLTFALALNSASEASTMSLIPSVIIVASLVEERVEVEHEVAVASIASTAFLA